MAAPVRDPLIRPLPPGPLDVIGDVHGEIDVLDELLARLGYDAKGAHPDGRRLVFVGDLVDRGPDSPAVLDRVMGLAGRAGALCILGNHELNLLRGVEKHGNSWWVNPGKRMAHPATPVSAEARPQISAFLERLPLVLERQDLRIVHACWHAESIAALKDADARMSAYELFQHHNDRIRKKWAGSDTIKAYGEQWRRYRDRLTDRDWQPRLLEAIGTVDADWQMANPVAVLTSGMERPASKPVWAGNRWRMVERVRWWDDYHGARPVVVGHYWRRATAAGKALMDEHGPDLFDGVPPHSWMGARSNVYCVDFSIGGRYVERAGGLAEYHCRLAALRVPEWQVVHDDGQCWSIGPPDAGRQSFSPAC